MARDWQLNANGCSGVSRAAIEFLISKLIVPVWVKLTERFNLIIISFGVMELRVLGWVWGVDRFFARGGFHVDLSATRYRKCCAIRMEYR